MRASQLRHGFSFSKLRATLTCVGVISLAAIYWHAGGLHVWAARDVPVAFWAWRTQAPSQAEVERAMHETGARTLFLRAGQFHSEGGTTKRVRAIQGRLPRAVELHLVYNATPALLAEFERIEPSKLASVISETYAQDLARAREDEATVIGLQLDFDAPTRLLSRYARVVRALRERLPAPTRLSITGLPTWMDSQALFELLAAVDFWIPQCYGAMIPSRLEQSIPISSPQAVARAVNRARSLGKPFYAGLSAYGYALLYDARGALLSLRGDMNPALAATDANLQLVERKPFYSARWRNDSHGQPEAGEWRYVYRARGDGVIDGLVLRAGDSLVLDLPNAATLRESARAVRALAGEQLLGLCIFRLPVDGDPATLGLEQISNALNDAAPAPAIELKATRDGASLEKNAQPLSTLAAEPPSSNTISLTATNTGSTSALLGEDALTIDVLVPAGSLSALVPENFSRVETLCESAPKETNGVEPALQPCAARRANVIRLKSSVWMTGTRARALISFAGSVPQSLTARVRLHRDDGRVWLNTLQLAINGEER